MQHLVRIAAVVVLFGFGCGAGDEAAPLAASPASKPAAGRTPAASPAPVAETPWERLEPGLEIAAFRSRLAAAGDRMVNVLRIDPTRFRLRLLNASSEPGGRPRTVRDWSERYHLTAAINASMYQADMRSSVSLMLTRGHVNNPRVSKDKAVLAFDPLTEGLPAVQIIDRECQDFGTLREQYGTLVQSIRMVSCDGRNVWEPQQGAWSTAAIGADKEGRLLFIHARAPHTTHDLIEVLLELPLQLKNAMYVEGGSEAQMFVQSGGRKLEFAGSIEDPPEAVTAARLVWPIPNAVGIEPIPPQPARR
ncbi:MAG TPA: phosphodiester glycosidase family protein [Candidatus Polarisedimenticolia bacterium]|nr:phosphodiester glycosidase family protein [Candidatus Polarisedimenticolia bacterium]